MKRKGEVLVLRSSDGPGLTSGLIASSVCLRQGSRHQLHPAATLSASRDTEGSEINLAAAPKIEQGPPLEQDAGCVGTSRGHCGQQSYFCSATGPPGVDAHSFIRPPAIGAGGHRRRRAHLRPPPMDDFHSMNLTVTASQLPFFPLF